MPNTYRTKVTQLSWINQERIKAGIDLFGPHKAAGPDDIKPIVLQNLPDNILDGIVRIFTACMMLGYTPKYARMAIVSFLQKPSKADWSDQRSFRPISLCCHLWKLLERIIQFHLKDEGALVKPMHEHQYMPSKKANLRTVQYHAQLQNWSGVRFKMTMSLQSLWTSRGHLTISPMMPK